MDSKEKASEWRKLIALGGVLPVRLIAVPWATVTVDTWCEQLDLIGLFETDFRRAIGTVEWSVAWCWWELTAVSRATVGTGSQWTGKVVESCCNDCMVLQLSQWSPRGFEQRDSSKGIRAKWKSRPNGESFIHSMVYCWFNWRVSCELLYRGLQWAKCQSSKERPCMTRQRVWRTSSLERPSEWTKSELVRLMRVVVEPFASNPPRGFGSQRYGPASNRNSSERSCLCVAGWGLEGDATETVVPSFPTARTAPVTIRLTHETD